MSLWIVLYALLCGALIWFLLRKDKRRRLYAIPLAGFLLGSFVLLRRLFFVYHPAEKTAPVLFALIIFGISGVVLVIFIGLNRAIRPISDKLLEIRPQANRLKIIKIAVIVVVTASIVLNCIPIFNITTEDVWKRNADAFDKTATTLFSFYDDGKLKPHEMITFDEQQNQIYYAKQRLPKDTFGKELVSLCKKNDIQYIVLLDENHIAFSGNQVYQIQSGILVCRNHAHPLNPLTLSNVTYQATYHTITESVYLFETKQ
jgi:hypothetical protein